MIISAKQIIRSFTFLVTTAIASTPNACENLNQIPIKAFAMDTMSNIVASTAVAKPLEKPSQKQNTANC